MKCPLCKKATITKKISDSLLICSECGEFFTETYIIAFWTGYYEGIGDVLDIAKSEPEFPGEPPEEMKKALLEALNNSDVDLLVETLRTAVRLTKENIINRITTEFKKSQGKQSQ